MAETKRLFTLLEEMERLKDAAYKDSLTGLLNRGAAELYIAQALTQMSEDDNCMMIIVDLDNFKMVNDTLGHQAGDRVICTAANILSGLFRPGDVVARLGGDEYIVFLAGNVTKKLARAKGEAICEGLRLRVGDTRQVSVSSSVGIYFSVGPARSFQEMYRKADAALYQAKNAGKNQCAINDDSAAVDCEPEKDAPVAVVKAVGGTVIVKNSVVIIKSAATPEVIYVDASFCGIIGKDESAIIGRSVTDFIHPEDVSEFRAITENLAEHKGHSVQIRLRSAAGEWVYHKLTAASIEYGKTNSVLLNLTNVLDVPSADAGKKRTKLASFEGAAENRWKVNLAERQFVFHAGKDTFQKIESGICKFPDDLVRSGWIAPESSDRFMRFAADIFTGRTRGYGNFLVRSGDGLDYVWATISYRAQGDSRGVPYQVVGKIVPLNTELQSGKISFADKNIIPVPVIDGLVVKLEANVTEDYISKFWMEGSFQESDFENKQISYFTVNEGQKIYDKSDKVSFTNFFSREHLKTLFKNGVYWFFAEYRRIDSAGYIEWVSLAVNLYQKTMSDSLSIRLRINNCDDRHIWECYTTATEVRNRETNLYSVYSIKEIMKGLRVEAVRECCALVYLRIDGLEALFLEDDMKRASAKEYIVNMLSYTLGTRCIGTELAGGQYVFVFPDIQSETYLHRTLEMAFNYSKLLLFDVMPANAIHFFASVACVPLKEAEFDSLVAVCRDLSEKYSDIREDKIVFYRAAKEILPITPAAKSDIERKIAPIDSSKLELNAEEQIVLSDCLSDMLLAATPEKGLYALFQRMGSHYAADRIYIISLENTSQDVEVFCEWRLPHLETISITLSRTSLDKLQLLTRCSIERRPMYYSAKAPGRAADAAEGEDEWNYCIFPVHFSDHAYMITDFLCIENPKKHLADFALMNRLLPYIKNQKLKAALGKSSSCADSKSRLEALPNLHGYIYAIPEIIAQNCGSMGAFFAKVPRLSILNSQKGFDYGRGILGYIADIFSELSAKPYVFRSWDNEFIAIAPNMSQEMTEEKYKSLKAAFERKYGDHIHISYQWTEGTFTKKEFMDMAKVGIRGNVADVERYLTGSAPERVETPKEANSFTVFLQPVIDVKTERPVGAELLVRGVNQNGDLVEPHRFLKQMEHNRTIKTLDLFVLEQALSILERWDERGVRALPLSVNFSKTTILDPTIVASFLAIRSRFPQLGDYKIGIELPQNIGEENSVKVAAAMEQLREFGAEFALDDVGVDKENAKLINQLRFDTVKIDGSLMVDVGMSEATREMIRAIASVCIKNKAVCVAEGIETREQLDAVRKLGCGCAQGFYFERPMAVEEFEQKYLRMLA